jgi:hypothetical protein
LNVAPEALAPHEERPLSESWRPELLSEIRPTEMKT